MIKQSDAMHHFYGSDQFPNKRFKIYTIDGIQSGQILHTHDYMQIWYIVRGQCHHWVEGVMNVMVAGEAFIIPPEVPHRTVIQDGSEIIGCEFNLDFVFGRGSEHLQDSINDSIMDLSFMMLFFPDPSVRPKYVFPVESQITVERIMHDMLAEHKQNLEYSHEIVRTLLLHLLLLFAREFRYNEQVAEPHDVLQKHKEAVKDTIAYIDRNFQEKLSLEDVCKRSLLSKTYFCYLFKMMTNQTFLEYLSQVRINQAKQLLTDPEQTVTEISYAVGFNDAAHFSKSFRRLVGLSPSEYRKHYTS